MSVHERMHPGIYTDGDDNIWRKMSDGSWTVNGQAWLPFPSTNDMKSLRTDISTPAVSIADVAQPIKARYSDIILSSQQEATLVLDELTNLIENQRIATVADLYVLVGLTPIFNDTKLGWKDIHGATINRVRDGYLLNLPAPKPVI